MHDCIPRLNLTIPFQVDQARVRRELAPVLFVPDCKNVSIHPWCFITLQRDQRCSDYSGLPLLEAITSASDEGTHRLTRFWVYGNAPQADGEELPFLFINGGAATLSASTFGAAIVRDTITQREIQLLEHTGICRLCFLQHLLTLILAIAGGRISAMVRPAPLRDGDMLTLSLSTKAHHVSDNRYDIATVDRGGNATIKVWTMQRPSSHLPSRVSDSFGRRWFEALSDLLAATCSHCTNGTGCCFFGRCIYHCRPVQTGETAQG